ncbi:MAG: 4'-phosphopantetheinyl transferase superfamily protein [Oscillospiraceae bacterium]|nr:4'-phosphopantetheinyl transferase superfamily protein [Oscillospiraceae bacterium]
MKLYICENFKYAKWRKNIFNEKKLSLVFAKKCICDFLSEKEHDIDIIFSKNEYGKPYVREIYKITDTEKIKIDISIFFSLSHSDNMIICAVACFNIGLDCQKRNIEDIEKCKNIAKRFYSGQENIFLDSVLSPDSDEENDDIEYKLKEQEYINDFFRIWTKKEAYIKYTGKGLSEGMNTFSVTNEKRQKNYYGDVYFKRIYLAKQNKFYIYLCYNKENKNICRIKFFN